MITVSIEVPDEAIADAVEVSEEWFGLRLTPAQMSDVLASSPLAALEVRDGLDTLGRERLIDAMVEHVGMPAGSSWPINADSEETRAAFYPLFAEKCQGKGWEVLWDVEDMTESH